ncbi:MAG: ribulokinase, partial [Lentisphaeria bacterium]|nr:ribulokinase [Lentisphaeria bacterium]
MKKYAIGIDYGTLSARALLVDLTTGAEAAVSEYVYKKPLLTGADFSGIAPDAAAALQDPQDYLDALGHTIRAVLAEAGVEPGQVVGIGMDVTSSTVLPVDENAEPLCFSAAFRN